MKIKGANGENFEYYIDAEFFKILYSKDENVSIDLEIFRLDSERAVCYQHLSGLKTIILNDYIIKVLRMVIHVKF